MTKWLKSNLFQVIISVLILLISSFFTFFADSMNEKIEVKATKSYVNEQINETTIDIAVIKKDIEYIKEAIQRIEQNSKVQLDKIEIKIDRIQNEIND